MITTNVYLNITQDDIDAGWSDNCFKCPGALAAIRVFGDNFRGMEIYNIILGDLTIRLPSNLIRFITKFDTEGDGKPEVFELQVPINCVMLPIINNIVGV